MKKVLSLLLCVIMILSIGCQRKDVNVNVKQEESKTKDTANSGSKEETTKEQSSSKEEITKEQSTSKEETTKEQSTSSEEMTTTNNSGYGGPPEKVIEKPRKITVMWDGSMLSEADGGMEFAKALSKELGIAVEIIRPEHSTYYNVLQTAFVTDNIPDVFILSSDVYADYAATGVLYDMTDMWKNSEMKYKFDTWAVDLVESHMTGGKNSGQYGLYGFPITRGNGCVTYVRTAWLEACGYAPDGSDIKTYQDYYEMLIAFRNKYNVAPVTASQYLAYLSAPGYTGFLPEFYQNAYPDFYQNSYGVWVDGFSEQAMKDALKRLQQANRDGLLDPDMQANSTTDARNGFYSEEHGVITYWAGTWAQTLTDRLDAAGVADSRLTALKPIEEVGKYIERKSPVIVINKGADNPEGIFKYFIEPIYDGGEVQSLWTYGVKGVHWSDEYETITLKGKDYTYSYGEFHFLLRPSDMGAFVTKNYIDPLLSLGSFDEGKDPAQTARKPLVSGKAQEVMAMFNANSILARQSKGTVVTIENAADIWYARSLCIYDIVANGKDVDEAMADYKINVGIQVNECLDSLNDGATIIGRGDY